MAKKITLTTEQKANILTRFQNGETNKTALAREFGTSARTVGRIVDSPKVETVEGIKIEGFQVGDLITGLKKTPYLITTNKATMVVTDVRSNVTGQSDDLEVKIQFSSNFPQDVGGFFKVKSEYFTKIGTVSRAEVVEEIEEPVEIVDPLATVPYSDEEYGRDLEGMKVLVSYTGIDYAKDFETRQVTKDDQVIGVVKSSCADTNPIIEFEFEGKTYRSYLASKPSECDDDVAEFALLVDQNVVIGVEEATELSSDFNPQEGDRVMITDNILQDTGRFNYRFKDEALIGKIAVIISLIGARHGYLPYEILMEDSGIAQWVDFKDLAPVVEDTEIVKEEEPIVHFTLTELAVALTVDGNVQVIDYTHPLFAEIRQLIVDGSYREASEKMDIKKAIETYSGGRLQINKGLVEFDGRVIQNSLADKMVGLMGEGDEGFKGFAKFFELAMEIPSYQARERLMTFVAAEDIGLNVDGHIVAFKNVKDDFRPSRSGKWTEGEGDTWIYEADEFYDNNVGSVCSMPRSEVNDNDSDTCSTGLHVCSVSYLKAFWGRSGNTMKVTIDPRDVVSIPTDYNNSKARVARYTVVENVSNDLDKYLDKVA